LFLCAWLGAHCFSMMSCRFLTLLFRSYSPNTWVQYCMTPVGWLITGKVGFKTDPLVPVDRECAQSWSPSHGTWGLRRGGKTYEGCIITLEFRCCFPLSQSPYRSRPAETTQAGRGTPRPVLTHHLGISWGSGRRYRVVLAVRNHIFGPSQRVSKPRDTLMKPAPSQFPPKEAYSF
jgi:hypothetical protein